MEKEDALREQMEDTRTALTEKLEALEAQVAATVTGATENVAETVEAAKETVEETIGAVKDSVREGIAAVKEFFDIRGHVDHHPWLMAGGSMAVGYVIGSMLGQSHSPRREETSMPQRQPFTPHYANGRNQGVAAPATPSWLTKFAPELTQLKNLALSYVVGALGDIVHKSVPPDMGSSLDGIIAGIGEKLTGMPPTRKAPAQKPRDDASDSYPRHREVEIGD